MWSTNGQLDKDTSHETDAPLLNDSFVFSASNFHLLKLVSWKQRAPPHGWSKKPNFSCKVLHPGVNKL